MVDQRVSRMRPPIGEDPSISDLLKDLGDNADEVAWNLYQENCQGPQNNDCFCPVAKYLTKRTGKAASATTHVAVLGEFTFDLEGNIDTFIGKEWTRTPAPVARLIALYDSGKYPFLQPDATAPPAST